AEAARQAGEAQADARKAAADALRVERQAEADGAKASLVAEAEGTKAKLLAEAEGKKEIANALNSYSAEAARMLMLPDVLASVVAATQAAAAPLSDIERLSIVGGAGDAQDAIGGLLGISPLGIAKVLETLKASGVDVAAMLRPKATEPPPVDNSYPLPTE
ncbi:MAG: flotillin domain-containing protein, partial [Mycobacterium sp.]